MPFTVTHVVAVLPFARLLPLTALAVGSMIPDLPLFVDIGVDYYDTHSLRGVVVACLPLGLAACLVWHRLIKRPLLALAPDGLRARLYAPLCAPSPGAVGIAATALAVAVGALTHVVWDAFTHYGRWGVEAIACLERSYEVAGLRIAGYQFFQHGSSLVFLPLLALIAWRHTARQPALASPRGLPLALRSALVAALLVVPLVVGLLAVDAGRPASPGVLLERVVTVSIATFWGLALAYGVIHTLAGRR